MVLEDLQAASRLTKDVREAASVIGREEARELVDLYYRVQDERIKSNNQSRALTTADRPHTVADFVGEQFTVMEKNMVTVLDKFSLSKLVGVWSRDQKGIGPVIAAGLLAHIDITKAPTVGHIWRFAGLDPTQKWLGKAKAEALVKTFPNRDEETVRDAALANGLNPDTIWRRASTNKEGKAISVTLKSLQNAFAVRPYNADLKVLCWKTGESFAKVQRYDDALYAHMYAQRKKYELERDARGGNAETAARTLTEKNFRDAATKAIYESGHLPAGRLDLRAKRWAVKLFLSHWHHVAFVEEYGEAPPKPYILTQDHGHAHYIAPPS
jgi:hypothetical protein